MKNNYTNECYKIKLKFHHKSLRNSIYKKNMKI